MCLILLSNKYFFSLQRCLPLRRVHIVSAHDTTLSRLPALHILCLINTRAWCVCVARLAPREEGLAKHKSMVVLWTKYINKHTRKHLLPKHFEVGFNRSTLCVLGICLSLGLRRNDWFLVPFVDHLAPKWFAKNRKANKHNLMLLFGGRSRFV